MRTTPSGAVGGDGGDEHDEPGSDEHDEHGSDEHDEHGSESFPALAAKTGATPSSASLVWSEGVLALVARPSDTTRARTPSHQLRGPADDGGDAVVHAGYGSAPVLASGRTYQSGDPSDDGGDAVAPVWSYQFRAATRPFNESLFRALAAGLSGRAGRVGRLLGVVVVGLVLGMVAAGCPGGDGGEDAGGLDAAGATCAYDESTGPESAMSLELGSETEGFICPVQDEDWYRFEAPNEATVLQGSLSMTAELSAVTPNYEIWRDDGGERGEFVAELGDGGSATHCVDQGAYFVRVHDRGDDDADPRHPYVLKMQASENPDQGEPNDGAEEAVPLEEGTPKTGYVACPGDVDWYTFEVPEDHLVRFRLTAEKPEFQPHVRFLDGDQELLAEETNTDSPRSATQIDRIESVESAGRHYLAVADDNGEQADPSTPYEVSVEFIENTDQNEPNNEPSEATELNGDRVDCGDSWSREFKKTGTIGASSDDDWYRLPLGDCDRGIVEASAELQSSMSTQEQWEFNRDFEMDLTLLRQATESPCDSNSECQALQKSCEGDLGCAGYAERCRADGLCAGAAFCLPEGNCAAEKTHRRYRCPERSDRCGPDSGEEPPPNRAELAAPLEGEEVVYLRVSDFQKNEAAPDVPYTLNVRVRRDPDEHEPSNVYTNEWKTSAAPSTHRDRAKEVPIYDCTGAAAMGGDASSGAGGLSPRADDVGSLDATDTSDGTSDTSEPSDGTSDVADGGGEAMDAADGSGSETGVVDAMDGGDTTDAVGDAGDAAAPDAGRRLPKGCCRNQVWTEGSIGYDNDRDYYRYKHPCPGEDCMVKVHYEVEGGPTDVRMEVHDNFGNRQPWFVPVDNGRKATHDSYSGTYGGLSEDATCTYASRQHGSGDGEFRYGVLVRDIRRTFEATGEVVPSSRDWDPDQKYRFCLEKVATMCKAPPCMQFEDGCGPPE